MKNILFVFLLVILVTSMVFSQRVIAYDNSQHVEFQTKLPDTIWIAIGTEQYKGDYSYLDWEETEEKDGNTFYSLSFKFFLDRPRIINVPYIYELSAETQKTEFEKRIGILYSVQIRDKNSIDFIIEEIETNNVVAILLNEEGKIIKKDNTYNFGILDTHQVIIQNGKIYNLDGFSLK